MQKIMDVAKVLGYFMIDEKVDFFEYFIKLFISYGNGLGEY